MEKEKTTEKVDQKVDENTNEKTDEKVDENTNEIQIKEQKEKKIIRTIEAKVVQFIDNFNLVLDKGSNDGIAVDDEVEIYYRVEISKELGFFDFLIAQLKVTRVKDNISLCISDKFTSNLDFNSLVLFGKQTRDPLPIKEFYKKKISEEDKKIGIGSTARVLKVEA